MKQKAAYYSFLILVFLLLSPSGCKKKDADPVNPPAEEIIYPEGLSWEPKEPEAGGPLTITFRAPKGNPLFGEKGDVYLHTGIISGGIWQYVPAEWNENISKTKMAVVSDGVWQLKMTPDIRTWFGAEGSMPVTKIGIVIRTADGTKKAYNNDLFISVKDDVVSDLPAAVQAPVPEGNIEGINYGSSGDVTLVLDDRDKAGVSIYDHAFVLGDFNGWKRSEKYAMRRDAAKGLWWITLEGLGSGEHLFQYELFSSSEGSYLRLSDPYSEKILTPDDRYIPSSVYPGLKPYPADNTSGDVSVFNASETPYRWENEAFQGVATDDLIVYEMHLRDFSAAGDLAGAKARLEEIASLGFNAVELMPVQEFTGNDSWGYNPTYYFALDKAYGTKAAYKDFIDTCHGLGLAVILDVVYNHMDGSSPFVRLYAGNNGGPSDRNAYFNTSAPHPFSVFHDFNHESPRTRALVKRNLEFLLREYRFDGFRFDLAKGFTQKRSSDDSTFRLYDENRISVLKEYASAIQAVKPDAYIILELFSEDKEERALAEAGMTLWRNMNNAFAQAAMGWQENSGFEGLYRPDFPILSDMGYMESHDEERLAYKQKTFGVDAVKGDLSARIDRLEIGAAFFFLTPGPKMVWQYGEYGYDVPIDQNGRTGRKPVWSSELSDPLRVELRDTYGELIKVRESYPELFNEETKDERNVYGGLWAAPRTIRLTSGSSELLLVGNFNPYTTLSYTLPGDYALYGEPETRVTAGTAISLAPAEYRIYVRR